MTNTIKTNFILITFFALIILGGCAGPYVLNQRPTADIKSFKNIEVAKVEVGITESELDPETTIELRIAIVEQIKQKRRDTEIAAELDFSEGVLQIQPRIIEFDEGDRLARWVFGGIGGLGEAVLDVSCKFINKETGDVVAEGTFSGDIGGGFFGGKADQKLMSEYAAKKIAIFMKKGK